MSDCRIAAPIAETMEGICDVDCKTDFRKELRSMKVVERYN